MVTITEDYVSFETAKLLKEKGFNEQTRFCFRGDGNILHNDESYVGYPGYYPRPTLQMAMKWLREVHNIPINVLYNSVYYHHYKFQACIGAKEKSNAQRYDTYEEACDAGIRYCLKNLI